jgi:hypothetical protein
MIQRETATHEHDLPHQFRSAAATAQSMELRSVCRCGSVLTDPIHRVDELMHPERAFSTVGLVTEKGV